MIVCSGQGYWIKILHNDKIELGSDSKIASGLASWTKGSQNIKKVFLSDGIVAVSLESNIDSEWYQFDRLVVQMANGKQNSQRVSRAIQIKIRKEHVGSYLQGEGIGRDYIFSIVDKPSIVNSLSDLVNFYSIEIIENMIDKWVTITVPLRQKPYWVVSNSKGSTDGDFKQVFR